MQHVNASPVIRLASVAVALAGAVPSMVLAHGFAGQRFFPATIATDDPFVADELSLPTVTSTRFGATDDAPPGRQETVAIDFSKRLTQNFGLGFGTARERFTYGGAQPALSGNDNLEVGAKYLFYLNEPGEALLSGGLIWEVGGTGSKSISDSFSTYTPTVYFGKGFGQLPSEFLRPLALTGTLGISIPGRSSNTSINTDPATGAAVTSTQDNPHVLRAGLALEYSIPYLQSAVKDVGLGPPWNRMVPLIEIAAQKPLDRVDDRRWIGTINPGVLWAGRYFQVGLEAVVPMNRASGRGVGVQAQLHFFLDDLFPRTIGKPLLGG